MGRSADEGQERRNGTGEGADRARTYEEIRDELLGETAAMADRLGQATPATAAAVRIAECHARPAAQYIDGEELVAAVAARLHRMSNRVADAVVRISEALRASADEHPGLTDEEAIAALHAIEDGVRRAGVRRAGVPRQR
jgi:hypothetical protein